jgi:amino acid transporter
MTDGRRHQVSNEPLHTGEISTALARNRLGVAKVSFFQLAGIGPLMVTAGLMVAAYAATGLTGLPTAFLGVAVVLALFSKGYVAMGRHVPNAGALYAYIARGLGRPAGVAGAMVALEAYTLLQVGLYGLLGPQLASFAADNLGWFAPWWVWALVAWALVALLGVARVGIAAWILGVFSMLEITLILAVSVHGLAHPAGGQIAYRSLSPSALTLAGAGPLAAIATLGFEGFETGPNFSEEVRDRRRTIARATALVLCGAAVVYALASFAMDTFYGGHVVSTAQQMASQGPAMFFALDPALASAGRVLLLTSLFAAALAFHNSFWRYLFALGREGTLPPVLGRTGRAGVARSASLVQSAVGLGAILLTRAESWDPIGQLFYYAGTTGGFGVLVLLAVTSVAELHFFHHAADTQPEAAEPHPRGESVWTRRYAPAAAALALAGIAVLCADHFGLLLGAPPGSQAAFWLPTSFAIAAVTGFVLAGVLKARVPETYALIGLGPQAPAQRRHAAAITGAAAASADGER